MPVSKKKVIKSLDTLADDLRDLIKEQYPNGYEASVTRIATPKKEPIFVFPLETEDATYLIKIPSTKNSDGEYDIDFGKKKKGDFEGGEDDDIFASNNDEESDSNEDDYDGGDDDGGGGRKEQSYDPDFDN
jgi:hypothetical protein